MYVKTRTKIEELKEEGIFPGATYGFIKSGQAFPFQTGLAAVEPVKEPIRENQIYDVASLTKVMMTTTVLLQLLEERKIKVDDPLKKHLPAYPSPQVTIRHLLTHTSAIHGYIPNRDVLPPEELKKALMNLPVGEKIGQQVVYTDTGLILLGFMIENIEQEPLTKVFERRVIQPLELSDSTFFPTDKKTCAPTERHKERGLIRGDVHDPKAFILKEHCGSAGLFSSLRDCMAFAQMMLNKGELKGKKMLETKTVASLVKDWTPTGTLNRSLGWDLKESKKKPSLFHTGFTGTFMLVDIQREEAFVFLSNRVHPINNTPLYLEKREELLNIYFTEKNTF